MKDWILQKNRRNIAADFIIFMIKVIKMIFISKNTAIFSDLADFIAWATDLFSAYFTKLCP
jgi:hypothetical protein